MIVINVDPVAFHIGPLAVRWYGLMYVVVLFGLKQAQLTAVGVIVVAVAIFLVLFKRQGKSAANV
jgi:prolipoprotein diacylglyceryltransferase